MHAAFECLVDIVQAQQQLLSRPEAAAPAGGAPAAPAAAGAASAAGNGVDAPVDAVLLRIAQSLLALGEQVCIVGPGAGGGAGWAEGRRLQPGAADMALGAGF